MVNAEQEGHELNGTVHVGTRDDLAELAHLYRCTYPHATDANLARDIRPEEISAWVTFRDEEGEILIAMFIRADGFCWLLADPQKDSLKVTAGFLALVEEARKALAPYGVNGIEVIYAPSLEKLAARLEAQGLIGPKTAVIRTARFDERIPNPGRVN